MRELCERVDAEIERINGRDWRVCEVDEGGRYFRLVRLWKREGERELRLFFWSD